MTSTRFALKAAAIAATALLAGSVSAEAIFGFCGRTNEKYFGPAASDFGKQGSFFSSSDYGYVPGGEDKITGKKLGSPWNPGPLLIRGQNLAQSAHFGGVGFDGGGWLSDGADSVFGLSFNKPFVTTWEIPVDGVAQFEKMDGKTPSFEKALIQWGRLTPKAGTWGVCVLDADGNLFKGKVDAKLQLMPFDESVVSFPKCVVKKIYVGVQGGDSKDNFAEVYNMALIMSERQFIDNNVLVVENDAFRLRYYGTKPGSVREISPMNYYFNIRCNEGILSDVSPYVELDGKRLYASSKIPAPVKASVEDGADVLRYPLSFELPDGKLVVVDVEAFFAPRVKDSVKFVYKAKSLPSGAKLGVEMTGSAKIFGDYLDAGASVEYPGAGQLFRTPAGKLGIDLDKSGKLLLARIPNDKVAFSAVASGSELSLGISLPIGLDAGVQPEMLSFTWRPSLAAEGSEGIAPFMPKDLELLETVELGDPNDPHEVYDITNDPLILKWRKDGSGKLPSAFGRLDLLNAPEKGAVPLTKVLGQNCRAIGDVENTYFRFNVKTKFEPRVPYLIVVEHAFDKERRGEFHSVIVDKSGDNFVVSNHFEFPYGGFRTGKGPFSNSFKKESVFIFSPSAEQPSRAGVVSFCFSNTRLSSHFKNDYAKESDTGLAVKSVSVYRIVHLPETPDVSPLLPEGERRHVVAFSEGCSPWMLDQFPKLYGYDSIWSNHQSPSQFLYGYNYEIFRPRWGWVHGSSLQGNSWLFEKAASKGVSVEMNLGWLLDAGNEGTERKSFVNGWMPGSMMDSLPLKLNREERSVISKSLDRALDAFAKYKSFKDVALPGGVAFSKRNLDDFAADTGVKFESSPVPLENMRKLMDSSKETIDAWKKWSCQKRFEFNAWILEKARSFRSDIYVTINQSWYINGLLHSYYGDQALLDISALKEKGCDSYWEFLRFCGVDPSLYAKDSGFVFATEMKPHHLVKPDVSDWPYEGSGEKLRDSFGGGLSVSWGFFDECSKTLQSWGCTYYKSRKDFRKEFVDTLLTANAREYISQTYTLDPARGRLADFRQLAIPFRLLPFAKPEPFAGKVSDSAKQALVKKYADRYALFNPGDNATEVSVVLPEGCKRAFDLSNGVRQELEVSSERSFTLHLEPWSFKTLEMK